jgi:hypothetical protein
MKIKALLTALFLAGLTASLALGATGQSRDEGTTTSTVTTTTAKKAKCHSVTLAGDASAGSVAFKATKASKSGKALVGTNVTLAIPAGARVQAVACTDASGALTLRSLHVGVKKAPKLQGEGKKK